MSRPLAVARVAFLIGDATRAAGLLGIATAHHLASGGRGWRVGLALDCAAAVRVPWQDAAAWAAACELVHQASIVHDDVQDGTAVRRGRPSVAARYGAATAICVGDQLLTQAFGVAAGLPAPAALVRLLAARVSEMVAGQADEFAPDLWETMTLERYRAMAGGKAGAAVALPIEGAALLAAQPPPEISRAGRVGGALGMAYQMGDDAVDVAADLVRGALNGVVAHALATPSPAQRAELLATLARGRAGSLGWHEAARLAQQLAPYAEQLTTLARELLAEVDDALAEDALGRVLSKAVAELRSRLETATVASLDAA